MKLEVIMSLHQVRRIGWALLFTLTACSGSGPSADEPQIAGTVVDAETKAPLAGVLISSTPATDRVTTGPDGTFLLTKDVRFANLFQITAVKDGYETQTRTITPSATEDNVLNIELSIQRVCTPGQQRCAQGGNEAIETCSTRGNFWDAMTCGAGSTCASGTPFTCIQSQRLTVTTSANGAVISNPAGINCGSSCTADFPTGSMVILTATPLAGGEFTGWGGACAANGTNPTCTVTMTAAANVSADFVSNIFGLTVRKMGRGRGTVTSDPMGVTCGNTCSAPFDRDSQVTLTAAPANGSMFGRWEGDCTGTTPSCQVNMTQARTVTAFFLLPSFPLTVTKAGTGAGTVTSAPAGIDCGSDCDEDFDIGQEVTLSAAADTGSTFMGWSGDCTGTADCTVTLDQARNVTATFEGISYALTVTKSGQGAGTVTSVPSGINCGIDCSESYGPDTMVTLTAAADAGSAFAAWTGDCAAAGTNPTCVVTMSAAMTADAQFDVNLQGISVTVTGGGVVTSVPAGINCGADCTEAYVVNTAVTLTATPNAGQVFTGWGGACAANGVNPTCALTVNAGLTVSAGFEAFYLRPLLVDAACTTLLHFDTVGPLTQACGAGPDATVTGTYNSIASRTAALAQAYNAGGATEEAWIDTQKNGVAPPNATVELTFRRTGAAFDARGAGVLYSDRATPAGRGFRVSVLDDGRLVAATRDGVGGTSTASTAPGLVVDGAWHHVAVTVSAANGLRIFVDGAQTAQQLGALSWTASSSTAWVGAEREQGAADAIYRFNGAVDEVRVSNTLRY
ncbi:MAG: hypothetical protein IPG45_31010 [Deltaproteobacteria bacterium]|nr:hypothetical protein [Deltaproteobacteria bacterium]